MSRRSCLPWALVVGVLFYSLLTATPSGGQTADDVFSEVGRRVPVFGGMFVDESKDTLYVYSLNTEPAVVSRLDKAITEVFGPNRPPQSHFEVLQGKYSFLQLREWHERITMPVLQLAGAVFTGVNQRTNALDVGISDPQVAPAVKAELLRYAVPAEAVNVLQTPPIEGLQRQHTLRDDITDVPPPFTELVGGVQTFSGGLDAAFETFRALCTYGFNATRQGVKGFVTNSHCTAVQGKVEDTLFLALMQESLDASMFLAPDPTFPIPPRVPIGVETVDPPYLATNCPAEVKCKVPPDDGIQGCRRSDSAFVMFLDGIVGDQGAIARPDIGSIEWPSSGILRGKPDYSVFTIAQFAPVVEVGQNVTKVGKTSGVTVGTITASGYNVLKERMPGRFPKGECAKVVLTAQVLTTLPVGDGDSGSPVFSRGIGGSECTRGSLVCLQGIIWGSANGLGLAAGIFSPITNVVLGTELGPLTNVCAPGFGC